MTKGAVNWKSQPFIVSISPWVFRRDYDNWSVERYFAMTEACRRHPILSLLSCWKNADVYWKKKKKKIGKQNTSII